MPHPCRHPEILDPLIEETVDHHLDNEPRLSDEITARDIFYREVSSVDRVLHALVDNAADKTLSENSSQQVSQYIHQANCILLVGPTIEKKRKEKKNCPSSVLIRKCIILL